MAKDKDYIKLIHTARWLRLRHDKLSEHPLCERCQEEDRITPATEVHHVRPVEEGLSITDKKSLMFDWYNLRALCHDCHVKTHTEMGRCGKVLAKNRARAQLSAFRKKYIE